jgi:hypothetical protein
MTRREGAWEGNVGSEYYSAPPPRKKSTFGLEGHCCIGRLFSIGVEPLVGTVASVVEFVGGA